jgi:hypothetical protein
MLRRYAKSVSIRSSDRTLLEHLSGRQKFIIEGTQGSYHFVIERGSIIEGPTLVEYDIGHVLLLDVL